MLSTFRILIPNTTERSSQGYKQKKKSKAYRLESNRKTSPICKCHDGLHRKSQEIYKTVEKNQWIQYNDRSQDQHTITSIAAY